MCTCVRAFNIFSLLFFSILPILCVYLYIYLHTQRGTQRWSNKQSWVTGRADKRAIWGYYRLKKKKKEREEWEKKEGFFFFLYATVTTTTIYTNK